MKSLTIEQRYFDGKSPVELEEMLRLWLQKAWFDKDRALKFIQHEDYSLTVEQDGDYVCRKCGRMNTTVVIHHIYGRRYSHIKNHPSNTIPLCVMCHVESSEWSAHKQPKLFLEWFEKEYPYRIIELRKLAHNILDNK